MSAFARPSRRFNCRWWSIGCGLVVWAAAGIGSPGLAITPSLAADELAEQVASEVPVEPARYVPVELSAVEQLVLVLSNSTNQQGDRQEVLVFLGRTKNRGWEAIGTEDPQELRSHWRSVAQRVLETYRSGLSAQQLEVIELAVELSITQFLRLYGELRSDFLDQPNQAARLALLAGDSRYERLRQLGRDGLFTQDSLVARVINHLLSQKPRMEGANP